MPQTNAWLAISRFMIFFLSSLFIKWALYSSLIMTRLAARRFTLQSDFLNKRLLFSPLFFPTQILQKKKATTSVRCRGLYRGPTKKPSRFGWHLPRSQPYLRTFGHLKKESVFREDERGQGIARIKAIRLWIYTDIRYQSLPCLNACLLEISFCLLCLPTSFWASFHEQCKVALSLCLFCSSVFLFCASIACVVSE